MASGRVSLDLNPMKRNMERLFCGSRWEKGQVYGWQTEDKIEAKLVEYLSWTDSEVNFIPEERMARGFW